METGSLSKLGRHACHLPIAVTPVGICIPYIYLCAGEKLRITHIGLGLNENGELTYDTEIRGQLPESPQMPPGGTIEPAQFRGQWGYSRPSSEVSGVAEPAQFRGQWCDRS